MFEKDIFELAMEENLWEDDTSLCKSFMVSGNTSRVSIIQKYQTHKETGDIRNIKYWLVIDEANNPNNKCSYFCANEEEANKWFELFAEAFRNGTDEIEVHKQIMREQIKED